MAAAPSNLWRSKTTGQIHEVVPIWASTLGRVRALCGSFVEIPEPFIDRLVVKQPGFTPITAYKGEWILKDPSGFLTVYSSTRFPKNFEPIELHELTGAIPLSMTEGLPKMQEETRPEMLSEGGMMTKARELVRNKYYGASEDWAGPGLYTVELKDVYVVWFSKTLQNWKALISTNMMDDMYYEVTHNGDKGETYIDKYHKVENVVVPD